MVLKIDKQSDTFMVGTGAAIGRAVVFLERDGSRVGGKVLPVTHWTRTVAGSDRVAEEGWSYKSATSSDMQDESEGARCLFEFTVCWRGC
jgi:hypothetical protein